MTETMCQSGLYQGRHEDERPAATLVIFPTGIQDPCCEDCARHWINLAPEVTRLAPLSAYTDHYAQAKAQLDAEQAEAQGIGALKTAYRQAPEDVLQRIAAGCPGPDDWHGIDLLMGISDREADQRLADGTYQQMADRVQSSARARRPAPIQDEAWAVMRARGIPETPPVPEVPAVVLVSPAQYSWTGVQKKAPAWAPAPAPGPEPAQEQVTVRRPGIRDDIPAAPEPPGASGKSLPSGAKIALFLGGCLASIVLGAVLAAIGHGGNSGGEAAETVWGVLLILAGLAAPVIVVIVKVVQDTSRWHQEELANMPPSQREAVRRAERAALWAAEAGAAVAWHEHNKHQRAQQRAQLDACQQAYEEQQRHEELLDAIRQAGQPQGPDPITAATLEHLERSAARRRH
jgi:hypothetical protein